MKHDYLLKASLGLSSLCISVLLTACGTDKSVAKEDVPNDSIEVRSSIADGSPVYGLWSVATIDQESLKKTQQIRIERGKITAITECDTGKEKTRVFASSTAIISSKVIQIQSSALSQRYVVVDSARLACDAELKAADLNYLIDADVISVTRDKEQGTTEKWKKAASL